MTHIKIATLYLIRLLLRAFYVFPVKKSKIVFVSYEGRQYSCNPKYVFEHIRAVYGSAYDCVWCLRDRSLLPRQYAGVRVVKRLSPAHVFHVMTAAFIISNTHLEPFFPPRRKRIFINTWHGIPYKKINIDIAVNQERKKSMETMMRLRRKETRKLISGCAKFTDWISEGWGFARERFLPAGSPRNDMFFDTDAVVSGRGKARSWYRVDDALGVVLYAPTYRGSHRSPRSGSDAALDVGGLLGALEARFNRKFVCLYRAHYFYDALSSAKRDANGRRGVILANDYPDMQELLCAADVLITDYSSTIWDFSFLGRPCFLFAGDVDEYEREQGFYVPITEWPFPFARTNGELARNIAAFDADDQAARIKRHHEAYGSFEDGHASAKICGYLFGGERQNETNHYLRHL